MEYKKFNQPCIFLAIHLETNYKNMALFIFIFVTFGN